MEQSHARYEEVFADLEAPFAFVDLDAMWANAAAMLGRAGGKPMRVASKSLRCRALLERILARDEGFAGLMTYTLPETLWLAEQGFEDLLLAYPTADLGALEALALRSVANPEGAPVVMVDCVEHLEMIESVLGPGAAPVRVCVDVDASWWTLGGRLKVGPKRSPVHTVEQAVELGQEIALRPQLELVGLMAYEGQIAGVGDRPPGRRARGAAIGFMQRRSAEELMRRRRGDRRRGRRVRQPRVRQRRRHRQPRADRRRGGGDGGDGGLGLLRPRPLRPLQPLRADPGGRVRAADRAQAGAGGGDGAGRRLPGLGARATRDGCRSPGCRRGCASTPRRAPARCRRRCCGAAAAELGIGDRVYMRHAKAGELCERFDSLYLVEGGRIVDEVPTYRGEGKNFL